MSLSVFRFKPLVAAAMVAVCGAAGASSHREAPFTANVPKVDSTDVYAFRSYGPERVNQSFVTLLANYIPLQAPYGGPNYFAMDPNALYEIHVDNTGDGVEDITFQFRFTNTLTPGLTAGRFGAELPIGTGSVAKNVAIPLVQFGGGLATVADTSKLNLTEKYTVNVVRGDRRSGTVVPLAKTGGGTTFDKPVDNIGTKTIPDYPAYAAQHVFTVSMPGCTAPGFNEAKVFVGQRKDPFALNLGVIFDLVNAPLGFLVDPANKGVATSIIDDTNITTLALEIPSACLTAGTDPVIGVWTTASLRQGSLMNPTPTRGHQTTANVGGAWSQVTRLGNPLVNELAIGLPDKDRYGASKPKDDVQFADYVTNPTLPALLGVALSTGINALSPQHLPRTDLLNLFLTGIEGLNKPTPAGGLLVVPSEMMRLNTSIAPTALTSQGRLGVAGGDLAGYPNGRRPIDDSVDISLVAILGGLCVLNGTTDVFKLNTFVIPGPARTTTGATTLTALSDAGATVTTAGGGCTPSTLRPTQTQVLSIHDGVDQATAFGDLTSTSNPMAADINKFPYLPTPLPGATN